MQEVARATGALLRAEVGYRGAFTIDGVATSDGFLPTELNPRSGAGLNVMLRGLPDLPLQLLLDALVGEHRPRLRPPRARARPPGRRPMPPAAAARGAPFQTARCRDVDGRRLVYDGEVWHPRPDRDADDGEDGDDDDDVGRALVAVGGGPSGGFVRAVFDADRTPIGESVGERAVHFWQYADRHLGTAIGPLTPAVPA